MRKNFGKDNAVYPMPVFIVAAYDKDGNANCMNAAWGGIYDTNQVMVCISEGHKTTKNILESKAFTVNIADAKHVVEADYVGIASGNKEPEKMAKAGFTTTKSDFVNAPIINELPMSVLSQFGVPSDGVFVIKEHTSTSLVLSSSEIGTISFRKY